MCVTVMPVNCLCCGLLRLMATHSEFTFSKNYQNSVVLLMSPSFHWERVIVVYCSAPFKSLVLPRWGAPGRKYFALSLKRNKR